VSNKIFQNNIHRLTAKTNKFGKNVKELYQPWV